MPIWVSLGALNAMLAIAAGAFGSHALKARLAADLLAVWETGARYHMYHSLGLVLAGVLLHLKPGERAFHRAGVALAVGIVVFSGSLYALALSGVRILGAITPLGGLAALVGWGLVAWGARRRA